MRERLVVMQAGAAPGELAYLQQRYRITSVFQPRLAVLEVADSEVAAVAARPGVSFILTDARAAIPNGLTDTERLFVRAWKLGESMDSKERIGAGLAWDTAGLLPPDPPP